MNNLALQIRAARLAYGTIFPNVVSLLNHWFCVCGNGHEWNESTGELYSKNDKTFDAAINAVLDGVIPPWTTFPIWDGRKNRRRDYSSEYFDFLAEFDKKQVCTNKELLEEFEWYPISEYSLCMTIPLDAPAYWKNAVIGTMRLVLRDFEIGKVGHRHHGEPNDVWARRAIERLTK